MAQFNEMLTDQAILNKDDILAFINAFNATRHEINKIQLFITDAMITKGLSSQQELIRAQSRLTITKQKLNKIGKTFIGKVPIVKMIDNQILVMISDKSSF